MDKQLLKAKNLSGGYHHKEIIHDVSFSLNRGDFLGIIGPNGSGKTTLLRLLSKILPPAKGTISLNTKDITSMKLKEFCRQVAFVPQDSPFNFPFNVSEIVLMGRIPHLRRMQQETKKDLGIVERALSMTDSASLNDKPIDELSSGERQRVIISRALAQEPQLILLDEPTSHLDIGHQIQILDLLKKLNKEENLSIIMIVHDLNLAAEYCNRIILMEKGRIFKEGSPEEVLTYQNIERVYNTLVVVDKNPINSKPYVILVSGKK